MMALPIVGLIVERLLDRYRGKAAVIVGFAAVVTVAMPLAWLVLSPFQPTGGLNVDSVIAFLNRDGHDRYRYITLGFGNALPKISTYTDATSVDGEYNSARLLPELTHYGTAQLTSAKFFGSQGMESLRAMLKHADHYGLKFIFIHDPYYEPLVGFAGWQRVESFDSGAITVWAKDDVAPAQNYSVRRNPERVGRFALGHSAHGDQHFRNSFRVAFCPTGVYFARLNIPLGTQHPPSLQSS